MSLNEFIADLQTIRAQYGDIQIWVSSGSPPLTVAVEDMYPNNPSAHDQPEKVVLIR